MSTFQEVIGDYRVVSELGSGAVGAAYRAKHLESGQEVAIKVMHDRLTSDPDIQNRFVREASVLEKLAHENIVRHVDCGLDEGRLYLVMEWVDFGSLEQVLKRRGLLPWREAVECAVQICAGLAHAHERGIIHRDLKPANLFLSGEGLMKIGDFGLARDADLHRLTQEGNTVGSCKYMAPEQIRGEDELTGAVDMYAVGCLLYRMLEGHVPYNGETIIEIFEHHLFSPIPELSASQERPSELDSLISQLLDKNPATRPGKASEVAEALQTILDGGQVREDFTSVAPETQEAQQGDGEQPPAAAPPAGPPEESPNLAERLVSGPALQQGSAANWKLLLMVVGLIVAVAVIVVATWGE